MDNLEELVKHLVKTGRVKNKLISEAFLKIDRKDFVADDYKSKSYEDEALPIGHGASISQPSTIAFILEKSELVVGDKILEIGTGSGYVTALLAYLVTKKGRVDSIEYIPELKETAEKNLSKYNFGNIKLYVGDGKEGLKNFSPFNKIISGAYVKNIPKSWREQLEINGKIITPFNNSIIVLTKLSDKEFKQNEFSGFSFVPLR